MREWFSYLSPKQQAVKVLLTYTASVAVFFAITNHYWSLYEVMQSMYPLSTIGVALMLSINHYKKRVLYKVLLTLFSVVPLIPAVPLMLLAVAFSGDNPYIETLSYLRLVLFSWFVILSPLLVPLLLSFFDWRRLLVKLHLLKVKA